MCKKRGKETKERTSIDAKYRQLDHHTKKKTTTTTTKMENKNITTNKKSGAFFTVPRNALRHRSRCQPHQSTHTHTYTDC